MTDQIDYQIHGESLQYLEIDLDPDEKVIAEAGMMMYMTPGIEFETRFGDGSETGVMGKLLNAAKRAITKESLFLTHFRNRGSGREQVAFAAPYPGQIHAIDLSTINNELLCQKDAFLCAARGTELSVAFSKKLGAGFFGGEGFVLERLRGDGMVFLHAGGTVVEKRLNGEKLRVDTGCLVAFESGIDYDITLSGGLKSMMFGGEGMFLTTLEGHGRVWLQSMPFARLSDRVLENVVHLKRDGE
jgi:uncharacterized protein (TIGR00266 family)